jgi:hypothetical protein
MANIYPDIPILGQPTATEDIKIKDAFNEIVTLVNGQLDNANIAVGANILGDKLANTSVSTAQLANLSVTTAKLADTSVTTGKLPDDAVTGAKIATDAVTADSILAGAVGSVELAALAVLSGKVKFAFHSGYGSFNTAGVDATGICASADDVPPGTYLALAQYGTAVHCHSPQLIGFTSTIVEAGSINNVSNQLWGQGSAKYSFATHVGMVTVNTTGSVGLQVVRPPASGVVIGEIRLFGISAA